uniref:PDZ domain-containing protein n=1 Tax=Macrostomum lignano TaxID=282301 RepID=A0A1I8FB08_9PLAT
LGKEANALKAAWLGPYQGISAEPDPPIVPVHTVSRVRDPDSSSGCQIDSNLNSEFERDIVVNENAELRRYCLALQTELYAARLTAKYLNKDWQVTVSAVVVSGQRGGRHPMGPGERQAACGRKLECKNFASSESRSFRCQVGSYQTTAWAPRQEESLTDCSPRQVSVSKDPGEGLGVSIVGGREHGAAQFSFPSCIRVCQLLRCAVLIHVGDAILSVDGVSLREARHHDAVQVLSHLRESTVELTLVFVADVDQPGSG